MEKKNGTEVSLNLSSNLIRNFNDETNFPHKLLLTGKQVSNIRKVFVNGSSANTKFSKIQFSKMQSGVGLLPKVKTGISGIDNFLNFPFKMGNSYLKELNHMGIKNIGIMRKFFS